MTTFSQWVITQETESTLLISLSGDWLMENDIPDGAVLTQQLQAYGSIHNLAFDSKNIGLWDSGLLAWLMTLQDYCLLNNIELNSNGLPTSVKRILALAYAVPERQGAARKKDENHFLYKVGNDLISAISITGEFIAFFGASLIAMLKMLQGRAVYRRIDFWEIIQDTGARALPIVSLVSFLVGMILAFVGAVQLQNFGAGIYIADLVGIAMTREMAAIMTAIIMAGRTGAAYAAEIGTMTVNEEVDALETAGFSVMEFLVLPRMLALMLMMPLLSVYADLMGILGGALVAITVLDLSFIEYSNQLITAVTLADFLIGVFMAFVFGIIISVVGCLQGIKCARSSQAVGLATTSAVVSAIVMIVVACALLTVIFNAIGI